jgi:hypothetical protein
MRRLFTFAFSSVFVFVFAFAFGLGMLLSCDPVHDHAIDDLGPEAPGVRKGPLHRPGQPCITCHDGALGSPPQFTVAGTIYLDQESLTPANGAVITFKDQHGVSSLHATTNEAGNFYVSPSEFVPTYPMKVSVTYSGVPTVSMATLVGRDGSCADCHKDPAGPTSAGHIFVDTDGGTP